MHPFRPPADAWSRRDFMRNGFGSLALLCTFGAPGTLKGDDGRRPPPRGAPRRSRRSRRSSATCRSRPSSRRCSREQGVDVYDVDIREGLAEILPGFETPIYGYDGHLPRADDPRPQGPGGDRAPAQPACRSTPTCTCTAATSRPRTTGTRWTSSRRAARSTTAYPNDQDAAFLWYHDHAHGRTAQTLYYGLVGTYLLHDEREAELELPAGRVRRAARARRPRVQQGRLVPLRGERRPRLPRRHDPRQRRGLAADARCSGGSTGCASSTRPTRAPTSCSSATGRRCCRSPATAACSSGRSRARASRCTRPSGSRC